MEVALTLTEIVVGLWLEWGGFGYALAVRLFRRCLVVRRVREFWYLEVPSCTEWKINSAMVSFNPNCYGGRQGGCGCEGEGAFDVQGRDEALSASEVGGVYRGAGGVSWRTVGFDVCGGF